MSSTTTHRSHRALLGAVAFAATLGAAAAQDASEGRAEPASSMSVAFPLALRPGARFAFAVRRNDWNPLAPPGERVERELGDAAVVAASPAPPLAAKGGAVALRFELEVREIDEEGAARIELALSSLASAAGEGSPGTERLEPVRFDLRVSREGLLLRVAPVPAEGGAAAREPSIPIEEIRADLRAILGSGLHSAALEKGETYAFDGRSDERAAGFADVLLRFDAMRDTGGQRLLAFTLFQPTESPSGDEVGRRSGEASYRARDGLLSKLSYRPPAMGQEGRSSVDWLNIERIPD